MINKRNFLKVLSTAVVGSITLGNCSNVWMMEKDKDKFLNIEFLLENPQHYRAHLLEQINDSFVKICKRYIIKEIDLMNDPQVKSEAIDAYVDNKLKDFVNAFKKYLDSKKDSDSKKDEVDVVMTESKFKELLSSFYAIEENKNKVSDLIDAYYAQRRIHFREEYNKRNK